MLAPMRTRPRPRAAAVTGFLLCAGVACDGASWLSLQRAPSFREVEVEEARRIAALPDALLVQPAPRSGAVPVPGAAVVRADEEPPPRPAGSGPVVVLARESRDGYRLAARLARAGIQDVAVYAGDMSAWLESPEEVAAAAGGHADAGRAKDRTP